MGIFTSNTHSSISGVDYTELPALEGYDAVTGCAMAMLEVQQNDMALFNATIMEDFKEVAAVNEGYEVLNESAADVLNKIKEIFKKLIQKIKSIFKTFLAKLMGTFGTNAGMYDKYKNQISRYTNWKDFKVKDFREVKGKGSGIEKINEVGEWRSVGGSSNMPITYSISANVTSLYTIDITKKENFADSDEICEAIMNVRLVPNLSKNIDGDLKNMTQEFMDAVFEDKEAKDEWTVSEILNGCVGSILQKNAGGKFKQSVEEANKSLNNAISKIINELDKSSLEINKASGNANLGKGDTSFTSKQLGYDTVTTSDGKMNKVKMNKSLSTRGSGNITKGDDAMSTKIGNLQKIATQEQNVITAFTSARLTAIKFLISQARKVWSSAAAYSSREHKNEGYEFYTAIGESAAYDFDSYMEAIGE